MKTDICKLLIPKSHLLNGYDNEEIYFTRLSDEILRYAHLNKYFFNKS